MNIGKAAVLALVASWAIYGQQRVRIPEKKAAAWDLRTTIPLTTAYTLGGREPTLAHGARYPFVR